MQSILCSLMGQDDPVVLMASLATLFPAIRASRIDIRNALRHQ